MRTDMQAARAPRDLAVAAKVQATAQALRAHVHKVEAALTAAHALDQERQQQRQPQLAREEQRKLSAVASLAKLKIAQTSLAARYQELKSTAAEDKDKAASDREAALQRRKEAVITLKAARLSEIEDEGKLRALERRWRETQQQLAALDAVKPR
jgi:hypothetical protein